MKKENYQSKRTAQNLQYGEVQISNISYSEFRVTVSYGDETSKVAYFEYYLNGELKATVNSGVWDATGLSRGTTYNVTVKVYDNAGNQSLESNVNPATTKANTAPVITKQATGTPVTNTNNQMTITAIATDIDNDQLTYTLYWGTSSSDLKVQSGTKKGNTGQQISFSKTGLSNYGLYYFRIDINDGYTTTIGTVNSARTYCKTTYCVGRQTVTKTCSTCNGTKETTKVCGCTKTKTTSYSGQGGECNSPYSVTSYYCVDCGASMGSEVNWPCDHLCPVSATPRKSSCDNVVKTKCSKCSGSGTIQTTKNCTHGSAASHYYCTHGNNYSSTYHI